MQSKKSIKRENSKKENLKVKAHSGITLIALVITIIVLLILAGVALSALTGDSGILNNAESAKDKTNLANAKEQVALAAQGALTKGHAEGIGVITRDNLQIELDNIVGKIGEDYTLSEGEAPWTVKVGEHEFTVYANVKIEASGEIVEPEQPAETNPQYFEFDYDDTARIATLKGINPNYMPEFTYLDENEGYVEKLIKLPAYIKVDETSKITNIVIPETIKKGDTTYTVTAIANSAFSIDQIGLMNWDISEIESVIIPDTVTSIGEKAFLLCCRLTDITIPKGVTSIEDSLFEDCTSLTTVSLSEGITSIGNSAFIRCRALTDLTIPEGVTTIGEYAFRHCSSLTTVTMLEGIISIGDYAFDGCLALEDIKIPNSLESLGDGAFSSCESLTSITIPDGITKIRNGTFRECRALETIEIPVSVTKIESYAFYESNKLKNVNYKGTKAQWLVITAEMYNTNTPIRSANIICSDGTI